MAGKMIELDILVLTVGSGPDGDAGSLSRPLLSQSPHRENILLVLLQTVNGHILSVRVRH